MLKALEKKNRNETSFYLFFISFCSLFLSKMFYERMYWSNKEEKYKSLHWFLLQKSFLKYFVPKKKKKCCTRKGNQTQCLKAFESVFTLPFEICYSTLSCFQLYSTRQQFSPFCAKLSSIS